MRGWLRVTARSAGGVEVTSNPALAYVGFFQLEAVQGDVTVADNPALEVFGPGGYGLAVVRGDLRIERNPSLRSLPLMELWGIGGSLLVADAPQVELISLYSLVRAGSVEIRDTGLSYLGLGPPDAIPNFATLSFTSSLTLLRNPRLADLRPPSLTRLTELRVEDSPLLPMCQVEALAQRSGATSVTILGTDEAATCP